MAIYFPFPKVSLVVIVSLLVAVSERANPCPFCIGGLQQKGKFMPILILRIRWRMR